MRPARACSHQTIIEKAAMPESHPTPVRSADALAPRRAALLLVLLVLALALPSTGVIAAPGASATLVYAQHSCTLVRDGPSSSAAPLTQLPGGSDLTFVGQQHDSTGRLWDHVKLWSGVNAYVAAADVAPSPPDRSEEGVCAFPSQSDAVGDALADPVPPSSGPWPLQARGVVAVPTQVQLAPDAAALAVADAALGQHVSISAWAPGPDNRPWYQVDAGHGMVGWLPAATIRLDQPDPATAQAHGKPIWQPVAGKGMWFTNYLPHHSNIAAMIHAAKVAGLTHLYAEIAISQYGFYARRTLDRLLPAAHAAGLSVIAWVYPTLEDVTTDVRLTQEVGDYVTPSGDHVDGVATDVEEVIDSEAVYAYGQLVRALLGPDMLLVAAVLHPLSHPNYPYDAISASWNVLAPMDYWYSRYHHSYTPADAQRFVITSITTIRAVIGPALPIEELGQAYSMFTDDGTGTADAPTPAELNADLQVAQQLGCIGVSFFDWQTMTQADWQALTATPW
jgi:hypothetical protein